MSITWKSVSLVLPRPPLTVRCLLLTQEEENETMKTKVFALHNPRMNIQVFKVTPISSLSKSSEQPKSSAEDIHF